MILKGESNPDHMNNPTWPTSTVVAMATMDNRHQEALFLQLTSIDASIILQLMIWEFWCQLKSWDKSHNGVSSVIEHDN